MLLACGIVWLAGSEGFEGTFFSSRTMDVRAKLGFHAPYIERQDLDGLPIDGSALVDAYIAANAAIGTLSRHPSVGR